MSNISDWDTSAANNTDPPPNGWPENQAPSTVNDCAREMMAAVARLYNDTNGSLVTAGAGNTYTLTTNSGFSALADVSFLVFRADRANTGAATLAVDGLAAKAIHIGGVDIEADALTEDALVAVAYNSTDDAFDLLAPVQSAAQLVGELNDSTLSSNVPLKDSNEPITGSWTFNGVATSDWARLDTGNTFQGAIQRFEQDNIEIRIIDTAASADSGQWRITSQGDVLNIRARADDGTLGDTLLSASRSGSSITTVNFTNVDSLQYGGVEIGFRGAPRRSISSSDSTATSDAGGTIRMTGGTGQTLTLDADPADDSLIFLLNTSGNDWTIAASGTLTQGGTGTTGDRTLSGDAGMVTAYHDSAGNWYISGTGLS